MKLQRFEKPNIKNEDFYNKLILQELSTLNDIIAQFDERNYKLQGWMITLVSSVVVLGIQQHLAIITMVSLPVSLLFWIVSASVKSQQRLFIKRMRKIRDFLNQEAILNADEESQSERKEIMTFYDLDGSLFNYFKEKKHEFPKVGLKEIISEMLKNELVWIYSLSLLVIGLIIVIVFK